MKLKKVFTALMVLQCFAVMFAFVTFHVEPVEAALNILFEDDFETGSLGAWTNFGAAINDTLGRGGSSYSAEFNATTSGTGDRIRADLGDREILYAKFYVLFDDLPDSGSEYFQLGSFGRVGSGYTMRVRIGWTGSAVAWQMQTNNGTEQVYTSSMQLPITTGTWYNVTIFHNMTESPSLDTYVTWINGTELSDVSKSFDRGAWPENDFFLMGPQNGDISPDAQWIADDVQVSTPSEGAPPDTDVSTLGYIYAEQNNFHNRTLRFACQPKLFYAVTRVWAFYNNFSAGYLQYRTSNDDGDTWTAATNVYTQGYYSNTSATYNNQTHVCVVVPADDGSIQFRMGELLVSGVITWLDSWQTVGLESGVRATRPNVYIDENFRPWVIWNRRNETDYTYSCYIDVSEWTNGTWSSWTAGGFPYNASVITYHAFRGQFQEVNGEGMAAIWYRYNTAINIRFFNYSTSTWGSIESETTVTLRRLNTGVDSNGVVHFFYAPFEDFTGSNNATYWYCNYTAGVGYSTPESRFTVEFAPPYRGENIIMNGTNIYLYWRNSSTTICSMNRTGGSWGSQFIWKNTASCNLYTGISGFSRVTNNKIALMWTEGSGGVTYALKMNLTTLATPPTDRFYLNFDFRDLDGGDVENEVAWTLFNASNPLTYSEGAVSLLNGTLTLETEFNDELINTTTLHMNEFGNQTVIIDLSMKSVGLGSLYLGFNVSVSTCTIHEATTSMFNFSVTSGASDCLIIVEVDENATYVQRNAVNFTGWYYNTTDNTLLIPTASLSTWTVFWVTGGGTPPTGTITIFDYDFGLLWQYLISGDYFGFITACFTGLIGNMFYGLIALVVCGVLYIRTRNLNVPIILSLLFGGLFETAFPSAAFTIGKLFIAVGMAVIFWRVFRR